VSVSTRAGDSNGLGEGTKECRRLRPAGGWGGDKSPSYNPPKYWNISSFDIKTILTIQKIQFECMSDFLQILQRILPVTNLLSRFLQNMMDILAVQWTETSIHFILKGVAHTQRTNGMHGGQSISLSIHASTTSSSPTEATAAVIIPHNLIKFISNN